MKTRIYSLYSICLLMAFSFSSCTSTKLMSSWRNPESVVDVSKLNKVLVMCLVKDETTRRVAEDEIVKRNPSILSASYSVLPSSALSDTATVSRVIYKGGYDAIIIMRLVSKEQETSYVQGSYPSYYGGWHGYYGYAAPYYYNSGYYQTNEYYSVETSVYSINPDKLIWTGITQTVDPNSIQSTIQEIVVTVTNKMKSQGFLIDSSKGKK